MRRGDLAALAAHYESATEPRGEIVLVIAPPVAQDIEGADVDTLLRNALTRLSVKEAVAEVAAVTGHPRREVYQRALKLAKGGGDE